jgi:nitrogen-specific signal transduction histidine kinase
MSPYTALSSSRLNQDSSGETKHRRTDSTEAMIDELAHDLRQPLSAIEHLAFLLQMSVTDGKAAGYIEQIQDLIEQANRVLENARAGLSCASV